MDESVLVGTWHSGDYHKSKEDKDNGDGTHSRVMNHSDINDDNGYSAEDHKAVAKLKTGQTHHIDPSHSISKVGHKLTESNMNENTQNLISAIASGDTIASSAALSTALFGKIAEKMDARRKEIAKSMFKESVELDEADNPAAAVKGHDRTGPKHGESGWHLVSPNNDAIAGPYAERQHAENNQTKHNADAKVLHGKIGSDKKFVKTIR